MPTQTVFEECYRGRQSSIHHLAYLRTGKVFLILRMLQKAGISLEDKDVFDYGFGAGTFFRHCPRSARLFGVEIDPENVADVAVMLTSRDHPQIDLQSIAISEWEKHPLLERRYDVITCSHVLEHLDAPAALLRRLRDCLRPGGAIIALVPINERVLSPHHVVSVNRKLAESWASASGLKLADYLEDDPWIYWCQPLFAVDEGWKHTLAQAVSLGIGISARALGPKGWRQASKAFSAITFSRPTQAALLLVSPEVN
ncbi:MAG: class I SAM-dependent methyltransferase [Chthoniobacterales bacterium]